MPANDLESVNRATGTLASICEHANEISKDTQAKMMNAADGYFDVINDVQDENAFLGALSGLLSIVGKVSLSSMYSWLFYFDREDVKGVLIRATKRNKDS